VHIIGDIDHNIRLIYATVDNRKVNHEAPMNEMDDKICDQVFSIFIDPRTN